MLRTALINGISAFAKARINKQGATGADIYAAAESAGDSTVKALIIGQLAAIVEGVLDRLGVPDEVQDLAVNFLQTIGAQVLDEAFPAMKQYTTGRMNEFLQLFQPPER
jgi:hypothetical protein